MQEEVKDPLETDSNTPLKFSNKIKSTLAEIAKWSKFVGIIGFVICGILLLVALMMVFFGKQLGAQLAAVGQPAAMANSTTGIVYAVMAILYYFPAKHIFDFSVYTKQAVEHDDQESIEYSFDRLQAFFKFIGMVALVIIGFYGIAVIASLFSGVVGK